MYRTGFSSWRTITFVYALWQPFCLQMVVEDVGEGSTAAHEALALRGVADEHARRRSLLSRRAAADSSGADDAGTQLQQLLARMTKLLPGKLRTKMSQQWAGAARLELLACKEDRDGQELGAMQSALHDASFSATPFLDGAAPVELAADMWHAFLLRCVPALSL